MFFETNLELSAILLIVVKYLLRYVQEIFENTLCYNFRLLQDCRERERDPVTVIDLTWEWVGIVWSFVI